MLIDMYVHQKAQESPDTFFLEGSFHYHSSTCSREGLSVTELSMSFG